MNALQNAIAVYNSLSEKDKGSFMEIVSAALTKSSVGLESFVEQERFAKGRACPHCGSVHVVRNGRDRIGHQRYLCRDCKKTFAAMTNSVLQGTRKAFAVWKKFTDCMMNGLSVRKCAEICGIHYNTAFVWRHKILDALWQVAETVKLNGIVEADETFFAISYKGNHASNHSFVMPRPAHKRGNSAHIQGTSHTKVCVPCAVNRNGEAIAKIANIGGATANALNSVYDNRIEVGSTLVSDGWRGYISVCKNNSLNLVQINHGRAKKGIYHIQHVNNYHSQLKKFIRHFNGVSTKYLNNYLVWNTLLNCAKETFSEKQNALLRFIATKPIKTNFNTISLRPAIPLAA